jgi:hypothetical protein
MLELPNRRNDMDTTVPAANTDDLDILQYVSVTVPCAACGSHYEVPLRQILLSHQLLHQGCPVSSETECPQVVYAALLNEAVLREFERSWAHLIAHVRDGGLSVEVSRPLLTH